MTFHRIEPSRYPHQAKHRHANRAKGLCICCGKPAAPGRVRCERCLVVQRAAEQKRRDTGKAPVSGLRKRLKAMRSALRTLSRLDFVDSGDAQDILDADDKLRRGR